MGIDATLGLTKNTSKHFNFKVLNDSISTILVTQYIWLINKFNRKLQILLFKIIPKRQNLVKIEEPMRNSQ